MSHEPGDRPATTATATFAGGCFWCVDAVFRRLDGVLDVEVGYTGGASEHPTYEEVCSGRTGHAEAVRVTFDPARVTFGRLLEVFFATHDPTTKNRQGADVGTQYRSAIFVHDALQRAEAEAAIARIDASGLLPAPVVTEVVDEAPWWPGEDYHQDYWTNHPGQPYCEATIPAKLTKLRKLFADDLRPGA